MSVHVAALAAKAPPPPPPPPTPPPTSTTSCDDPTTWGARSANNPTKLGFTQYLGTGTVEVTDAIFDADVPDDLVRVYNGKVVFNHVTFLGRGTGKSGA
jgi:hypothetical protein